MPAKPFDANINVLLDAELKMQLVALARSKQLYGFSTIVRSLIANGIPLILNQMTDPEREEYSRVLNAEHLKYFAIVTPT